MALPSWFYSLQFRLILAFTAALTLALAGVGAYVGLAAQWETDRFQERNQEFRLGRVQRMVERHFSESKDWDGLQPSLEQAGSLYDRRFVVTNFDGQVMVDSHHLRRGERRWELTRGRTLPIVVDDRPVGFLVLSPAGPAAPDPVQPPGSAGDSPPGNGRPAAELSPLSAREPAVSRLTAGVRHSLWWGGLAAAAGGVLLLSLVSRRLLAPVQALSVAARRLGQGDLSQRVPADGPNELRRLGETFNVMAENLQAAEQHRRNLVADVAHELRTPLSNIQGYLEAVNDGLLQPDQATIDALQQQTAHLVTLVEDLQLLALAEAGALSLGCRLESVAGLLAEVVEAFRPRAEAAGVQLLLQVEADLPPVTLDRTRIAQVVNNLLENAVRHTPQGGTATVAAATAVGTAPPPEAGAWVEISVADTGPGIPPDDLPRLFDRFYRVDASRTRATGGAGLGLTIARQLAQAHGGDIRAESRLGAGARFCLTLPVQGPKTAARSNANDGMVR